MSLSNYHNLLKRGDVLSYTGLQTFGSPVRAWTATSVGEHELDLCVASGASQHVA